jgi:signal peptidase I
MNSPQQPVVFKSGVELVIVTGSENIHIHKPVTLAAKFTDFLGEPTTDTGQVYITASRGELTVAGFSTNSGEIMLQPGEFGIGDSGELPIVLNPGKDFGTIEVQIRCDLGEAKTEVLVPAPSGYAMAIIIRIFFFQTFWIPSGSMEPTLYEQDRIIANKLVYRTRAPARGEVIIFRVFQTPRRGVPGRLTMDEAMAATDSLSESGETGPGSIEVQDYIKRVVGLPGDTVEIDDSEIYINGEILYENYRTRRPNYSHYGPITVPPGEVFVLGDNRSNSQDSHVIGTVPIRNVEGRAEMIFWPLSRIGLIGHDN